jgi:ribonuclease E
VEATAAETVAATPSVVEAAPVAAEPASVVTEAPVAKPRRVKKELPPEGIVVSSNGATPEAPAGEAAEPEKKKKGGWWQRRLGLG